MAGWSCKNWDADAVLRQAAAQAADRHAVVYAVAFLPPAGPDAPHLLAAGYSTGVVRVFDWRQASQLWLGSRQPARHCLQWDAHPGGVYALTVAGAGTASPVLLSAGDDGRLRGWAVPAITEAAATQQQQQQQQQEGWAADTAAAAAVAVALKPLFEAAIPRAESPFPVAASAAPAAQTLSADEANGAVYVGASDGGCHGFDLRRLGGGGKGDAGVAASFSGHAAAVLGTDCCSGTGRVATASEDSTVRVWDARAGKGAAACVSAFEAGGGAALPPRDAAAALHCARGPAATCVRFADGGAWMVAGTGDGALAMWGLGLGALAKRVETGGCVPQALHMLPGEILMAGSEPSLRRYRFALDPSSCTRSEICGEAAFAIDVCPGSGTAAVGGAGGVTLLSAWGTRLGRTAG